MAVTGVGAPGDSGSGAVGCEHAWAVVGAWYGAPVEGCDAPLRLECRGCHEVRPVRCGTSRASKCVPCAAVYRGRVGKVAGSGLVTGTHGIFLTLTSPGAVPHLRWDGSVCPCTPVDGIELGTWNAEAAGRWNRFVADLSRLLGADFFVYEDVQRWSKRRKEWVTRTVRRRRLGVSYFRAAEVQRRGALHFHVLLRRRDGRPIKISRREVRRLAMQHGFGHSVDVQRLEPGHASYVAKYVSKAADERRDVAWRAERWAPVRAPWRVDRKSGTVFHRETGEVVGQAARVPVHHATYRTWSCSRTWGHTMGDVRAAQQHYVLVVEALPSWTDEPARPVWGLVSVPARPDPPPALV